MRDIIFLDIDGVLNDASTKETIKGVVGVSDGKLKILKKIVEDNGAEIILTSSWKDDWEYPCNRPSDKHTIYGQYLDDRFAEFNLAIAGKTEDDWVHRGNGILQWLANYDWEHFVVLDDQIYIDFRKCGIFRHLVQTSWKTGLREKHIRKVAEVLQKEPTEEMLERINSMR